MTKQIDMDMHKVHELRQKGWTFEEISELYDCHRSTVNRRYNEWFENVNPHGVTEVDNIPEHKPSILDKFFNKVKRIISNFR